MERNYRKLTSSLIDAALKEDIGNGDITTLSTVPENSTSTAFLFSKQQGVLAGIDVALKVFTKVDPSLEFTSFYTDGDALEKGHKVFEVSGPVASILTAERTALNFLGRMSGIATATAEYVKKIEGTRAKILDTRKTIPTMRHLDKYAVKVGGGHNHRFGLFDMVLIKDNHIAVSGGIRVAVDSVAGYLADNGNEMKIEVECQSYEDVLEASYTMVDIIMLDNMDIADIEKSVHAVREINAETGRKIRLEASGNMTLDTVRRVAETGVDYISIGALTHSVINHDFSLMFEEL